MATGMVRVSDLSLARGGRPVLEGLSFEVSPGAALVLRGPNGIGKTTLLRTLAGLQPPLSGTIDLPEGESLYAGHADGIKAQLTVEENLAFWAAVHGHALNESALERFGLAELRERRAGTLSAGQRRRCGLARLAVAGRRVLLLDEPTVSLDREWVGRFADILHAHLSGGGCALVATHVDLGLAAPELDLAPYRASPRARGGSDEAFL